MTLEIAFVLFIIILMMVALFLEVARPDMIVFVTLTILLITGVLSVDKALRGFSNEGMLTIALLFIIAGAIQKSGIADRAITHLLGKSTSNRWTLTKILVPIAGFSGFLNNTPIVVALTPVLRKWCAERGISPSKFLIPLSYATILGGTITLMGTSTNLVIHGLMLDLGLEGFSFFQLGIVGVPAAIIGLIYIITFGYKLLPNHKVLMETFKEHSKEYLSEVVAEEDFRLLNKTIEEAGLRRLKGLYLIEIHREKETISPVTSTTKIKAGDRLIFTGLISTIAEIQQIKGLRVETGSEVTLDTLKDRNTKLVEAVVSHQSDLLYKKIKDTQFRSKYDAGVIAVHRNSERVKSKIGDISLKPGDTLLLLVGPDFQKRTAQSNDFYVTTSLDTPKQLENPRNGWITIGILFLMILFVTLNILPMFKAMAIVVVTLILLRIITPEEAKHYVQFNVLLLIASAFGIGAALLESGAAKWIAEGLVSFGMPLGILAIITIVYFITNIFTEIITNSAAAVIMFPIGMEVANSLSIEPMAIIVAITIAASAGFATPIGYQTNLIVYGPGGYKFIDYVKVGAPLNIIIMIITIIIVSIVWI